MPPAAANFAIIRAEKGFHGGSIGRETGFAAGGTGPVAVLPDGRRRA